MEQDTLALRDGETIELSKSAPLDLDARFAWYRVSAQRVTLPADVPEYRPHAAIVCLGVDVDASSWGWVHLTSGTKHQIGKLIESQGDELGTWFWLRVSHADRSGFRAHPEKM